MSNASMTPQRLSETEQALGRSRRDGATNHTIAACIFTGHAIDRDATIEGSGTRLVEAIACALDQAGSKPLLPLKTNRDVAAFIGAAYILERDAKKEGSETDLVSAGLLVGERLVDNIAKALDRAVAPASEK